MFPIYIGAKVILSWLPPCLPSLRPCGIGSLPSPRPASFRDLESSPLCLPGVERRCHSDFLLFICCMGRPDHSLFLQQIPQQLLQVCGDTSSPRGGWWVGLGPGDRTLGWVITCRRPHPHISPETGPQSCLWYGGNPLRRLSCGLLEAWRGPQLAPWFWPLGWNWVSLEVLLPWLCPGIVICELSSPWRQLYGSCWWSMVMRSFDIFLVSPWERQRGTVEEVPRQWLC